METLKPFNYHNPKSIDEAVLLIKKNGSNARLLAGGTDLLVMMKDRIIAPETVIDIKNLPGLDQISWDTNDDLNIGALVKVGEIIRSEQIKEEYAALYEGARSLGTPQLRNMATVAGNICRSSPSADLIPPLLVLDAFVTLVGSKGERTVNLDDFLTGPGQNLLQNEILIKITIPSDPKPFQTGFMKISRLTEDLAKVNCAVKLVRKDGIFETVKIAIGAVAPRAVRVRSVETALVGKPAGKETVDAAARLVLDDISPITDVRSSAAYRNKVSVVIIRRLLNNLLEQNSDLM